MLLVCFNIHKIDGKQGDGFSSKNNVIVVVSSKIMRRLYCVLRSILKQKKITALSSVLMNPQNRQPILLLS